MAKSESQKQCDKLYAYLREKYGVLAVEHAKEIRDNLNLYGNHGTAVGELASDLDAIILRRKEKERDGAVYYRPFRNIGRGSMQRRNSRLATCPS